MKPFLAGCNLKAIARQLGLSWSRRPSWPLVRRPGKPHDSRLIAGDGVRPVPSKATGIPFRLGDIVRDF